MKCLRVHGMEPRYYHKYLGWNARLDALHAAMLRVKLPHLERWIGNRQAVAARYDALIEEQHLSHFLERPDPPAASPAHVQPVRRPRRQRPARRPGPASESRADRLRDLLSDGRCTSRNVCAISAITAGDFPASEEAAGQVLALPMYPELTGEQQRRVIQSCAAFLRQQVRALPEQRGTNHRVTENTEKNTERKRK